MFFPRHDLLPSLPLKSHCKLLSRGIGTPVPVDETQAGFIVVADTLQELLDRWELDIRLNTQILQAKFDPQEADKSAAWLMYIELLTRVATQPLLAREGDEQAALKSVFSLFGATRYVLQENRGCIEFSKLAIPVLNQIIRPFTTKWHKISCEEDISKTKESEKFRHELLPLQENLYKYAKALAYVAGVEDLTNMEDSS